MRSTRVRSCCVKSIRSMSYSLRPLCERGRGAGEREIRVTLLGASDADTERQASPLEPARVAHVHDDESNRKEDREAGGDADGDAADAR